MNNTETIFIVDDDDGMRKLLDEMLSGFDYHTELFSSAQQFVDRYTADHRGCLLLDIDMPGMSGLELQQELADSGFHIPIIFITGQGDIRKSVHAMKAGAVDFLEKPFRRQTLLDCVEQAIFKNRASWSEQLEVKSIAKRMALLTPREHDVFQLLVSSAGNLSNKEIARILEISYRTVDHHRAHVFKKMAVDSVAELCLIANKAGISFSNVHPS